MPSSRRSSARSPTAAAGGCRSCCSSPLLCIATTFFIADVPPLLGLALFIVANFAYQAALIYYDATLKTVSYPATRGRLSGIGTGVGYCGTVFVGLLIFLLDIPVADRFRLTAVLFLVFAVPIFWFVREPHRPDEQPLTRRDITGAVGQLRRSIKDAGEVPGLWRFLFGRFFYSDAVNTVIVVMSVVVVKAMGLTEANANLVLLMLTFVAIVDELRVGLARRPARPEADARLGARCRGPSASCSAAIVASAFGPSGLVAVPRRRGDPRLRPRRRPGRRPGAHGPPLAARAARRVLRHLRAGRQGLAGRRPAALRRDHLPARRHASANGAYQVAVLSLLVTMLIGLWLIWPVRDDWAGSGEADAEHPPPRSRPTAWHRQRRRSSRGPSEAGRPRSVRGSPPGAPGATPRPSRPSPRGVGCARAPAEDVRGRARRRRRAPADRRPAAARP